MIHLTLILLYAVLSRFLFIQSFPQPLGPSLSYRLLSATSSLLSVFLLYVLGRRFFSSKKIGLFAAWLIAATPWAIEQGRIVSPLSITLPIFLGLILAVSFVRANLLKLSAYAAILAAWFFVSYPGVSSSVFSSVHPLNFVSNIFFLFSFDFLFFHNTSYWWGGVKEFGVLFLAFLPFFLAGMVTMRKRRSDTGIFIIGAAVLASLNPVFPEGRHFFLALPFLLLVVAQGMNWFITRTQKVSIIASVVLSIVMMYEIFQFWHYYTVHYPQDIAGNKGKITEPF